MDKIAPVSLRIRYRASYFDGIITFCRLSLVTSPDSTLPVWIFFHPLQSTPYPSEDFDSVSKVTLTLALRSISYFSTTTRSTSMFWTLKRRKRVKQGVLATFFQRCNSNLSARCFRYTRPTSRVRCCHFMRCIHGVAKKRFLNERTCFQPSTKFAQPYFSPYTFGCVTLTLATPLLQYCFQDLAVTPRNLRCCSTFWITFSHNVVCYVIIVLLHYQRRS